MSLSASACKSQGARFLLLRPTVLPGSMMLDLPVVAIPYRTGKPTGTVSVRYFDVCCIFGKQQRSQA